MFSSAKTWTTYSSYEAQQNLGFVWYTTLYVSRNYLREKEFSFAHCPNNESWPPVFFDPTRTPCFTWEAQGVGQAWCMNLKSVKYERVVTASPNSYLLPIAFPGSPTEEPIASRSWFVTPEIQLSNLRAATKGHWSINRIDYVN